VNTASGAECGIAPGRNYGIPAGNPLADGAGGACDEIWAYGLRNPWRFSFDRLTGDLWLADVGQAAARRSISSPPMPGRTELRLGLLGRNAAEFHRSVTHMHVEPGRHRADPRIQPLDGRCSITGGYVHRGAGQPRLDGLYFFADYCSGQLWTLRRTAGGPTVTEMLVTGGVLSTPRTFGQDANGELYVASSTTVFRIEA